MTAFLIIPYAAFTIYKESQHEHGNYVQMPHMKVRHKAFPWTANDCDFFDLKVSPSAFFSLAPSRPVQAPAGARAWARHGRGPQGTATAVLSRTPSHPLHRSATASQRRASHTPLTPPSTTKGTGTGHTTEGALPPALF
jgi:hypothetical protein